MAKSAIGKINLIIILSLSMLRHALEHAAQENADFDNITVYVAKDCTSELLNTLNYLHK